VHDGDGRMTRGLHAAQDSHHAGLRIAGGAALRLHLFEVPTRAERGPLAAHEHDAHVLAAVQLVEGGAESAQQRSVHRVALLRAIQRDGGDAVGDAYDDLVRHGANGITRRDHSMVASARNSRAGGSVRPRALAALRLITSSTFAGCSTGSSPGLAPLRILST